MTATRKLEDLLRIKQALVQMMQSCTGERSSSEYASLIPLQFAGAHADL